MKKVFKGILSGAALLLLVMTGCPDGGGGTNLPDPKAAYVGRVENVNLELDQPQSVTTAVIGANTYVFVAAGKDDGISVFSVAANGKLTNVDNVDDTDNADYELDRANSVHIAVIEGTTYLFVSSELDDGISVFSVDENGQLTNVDNVDDGDNTAYKLNGAYSVTTAVIGDSTYLFTVSWWEGISVFSVDENGQLTNVDNVGDSDNTAYKLDGAQSVTTTEIGGTTYIFATGYRDDGISVFSVAANGKLTNVANVDDTADPDYELDGVQSVATAEIGGKIYLFAASRIDDGISVFSVAAGGNLTNVANVDNTADPDYELNGAGFVNTAEIGGTTYLFVAGYDDSGISVFSVADDGTLTGVANVPDAGTLELDKVRSVATAEIGGTPYLFAVGLADSGISVFSVADPSNLVHVDSVDDTIDQLLYLDAVVSLATTTVSGTPYLLAAGETSDGFNVFQIEDSGMLSLKAGNNNGGYNLDGIKAIGTAEADGKSHVIATGSADNGITVFVIDAAGQLAHYSNYSDAATLNLAGISDVVTVISGGNTYIVAAGTAENGISTFSLAANTGFSNVAAGNIADSDNAAVYHLGGVSALATATVGTSPYVFAAGTTDNGISTFSLAANGTLTNVTAGNIADSPTLYLGGVSALATATVGTDTYLFAGGTTEDGISVFKVANNGGLTHVVSIADGDNLDYTLDGVVALSTVTKGTATYLMAASDVENGVSIWKVAQDGTLSFVDSVVDSAEYKMDGARDVLSVEINDILYFYVAGYNDDAINIFSLK